MAVLAPALIRLRAEVNTRWPQRDRTSDGWIGDPRHQQSGAPENGGSDHNPNRRNVVDAVDVDVDGIDPPTLVAAAIRHPATNYVIWNHTIWSRTRGFKPHAYTGSNPHTKHAHVSLIQSVAAENSQLGWGVASVAAVPATPPRGDTGSSWVQRLCRSMPVLRPGAGVRRSVRKLQVLLNTVTGAGLGVDGQFGPRTAEVVRRVQREHGLGVDAVVGPLTWGAVLGELGTLRPGASGPTVSMAQALLNVFGAGLGVDGRFGPRTGAAVAELQRRYGLAVDQVVGPATWTALLTR